jgi:hypothetical protein
MRIAAACQRGSRLLVSGAVVAMMAQLASTVAAAQASGPPARPLGPVVATAMTQFRNVSQVLELRDGRVLVADVSARLLRVFDSSLSSPTVVLDSVLGTQRSFTPGSFILPFRSDSVLYYHGTARALVVIEPNTTIGRVMALPPGQTSFNRNTQFGPAQLSSPTHGLLYTVRKSVPRFCNTGPDSTSTSEDSAYVLRMEHDRRSVDTIATLASGGFTISRCNGASYRVPLFPFIDDMVVTTDGSIALLNARTYSVEWITPDGTRSTSKVPYAWRRLTDVDRTQTLDSINGLRKSRYDTLVARRAADSVRTGKAPVVTATAGGEIPLRLGQPVPPPVMEPLATADSLPDYFPPVTRVAMLADGDNNVWIRQHPPASDGSTLWDVVDRQGVLVDRVLVPAGLTIVSFGARGVAYVVRRDGGVPILEKRRWR